MSDSVKVACYSVNLTFIVNMASTVKLFLMFCERIDDENQVDETINKKGGHC